MESQNKFMVFEVKYTNIGTLSQMRLHALSVQLSVADRIGTVKKRLSNSLFFGRNDHYDLMKYYKEQ